MSTQTLGERQLTFRGIRVLAGVAAAVMLLGAAGCGADAAGTPDRSGRSDPAQWPDGVKDIRRAGSYSYVVTLPHECDDGPCRLDAYPPAGLEEALCAHGDMLVGQVTTIDDAVDMIDGGASITGQMRVTCRASGQRHRVRAAVKQQGDDRRHAPHARAAADRRPAPIAGRPDKLLRPGPPRGP